MDQIFIIGNGFDRAHGLETSYEQFILEYLTSVAKEYPKKCKYEDEFLKITEHPSIVSSFKKFKKFESISEFQNQASHFSLKYKNKLLQEVIENSVSRRWVDIEYIFFTQLISSQTSASVSRSNDHLLAIKKLLLKYLEKVVQPDIANLSKIDEMEKILKSYARRACILNFNYTDTITKYLSPEFLDQHNPNFEHVQIHGNVKNPKSVIFGFGDDYNPDYRRISEENDNDYFVNLKSFGYLREINYQKLLGWLKNGGRARYQVKIIGHSCGISDRTLLREILQNQKCSDVTIFHHENIENYLQVAYEVSRHFERQKDFRDLVRPFNSINRCPQFTD